MPEFIRSFVDTLRQIDLADAIDIAILTFSIWWLLLLLRGTTAMSLLRGAAILLVGALALARIFDLRVLNWILRNSLPWLLLGGLIVFQPELRRALERVGRTGMRAVRGRNGADPVLELIAHASGNLSQRRHGALIVIERETGLEEYIASGRRLDAEPSEELLEGIFFRNAPLHDGAAILRGDRIAAAACTLPLSDAPLPAQYGTRHRAALGISERTDAIAIVISEETGEISLGADGKLVFQRDEQQLRASLHELVGAGGNGAAAHRGARIPGTAR